LGSMCKQLANKHCNLDQGQIKIKKNFKLMGDPRAQPAYKQAHFGPEYLNPTNVEQAHGVGLFALANQCVCSTTSPQPRF
jgi:hypothetical protein